MLADRFEESRRLKSPKIIEDTEQLILLPVDLSSYVIANQLVRTSPETPLNIASHSLKEIEDFFNVIYSPENTEDFDDESRTITDRSKHRLAELMHAIDRQVLDVPLYEIQDKSQIVNLIFRSVADPLHDSSSYPLFDTETKKIADRGMNRGLVNLSEVGARRGKHVALAHDLISRPPIFEDASISEVLDVREELKGPLLRFRSAVLQFSDSIKSEPWSRDFETEADQVIRRDVDPLLQEIEDAVESNKYLKMLARKATDKAWVAASMLTLSIASGPTLAHMAASALGLAPTAAWAGYQALMEHAAKNSELQQNRVFLAYELNRRLSR